MPIAGAIAGSSLGWRAAFYLYGSLGFCWCIAWFIFGASSPRSSRFITEEESKWIIEEIGDSENREVLKLYRLFY